MKSCLFIIIFLSFSLCAAEYLHNEPIEDDEIKRQLLKEQNRLRDKKTFRETEYQYAYINRDHTLKETAKHLSIMYGISWAIYPLSQPKVFREQGSWKKYKRNFGQLVFDRDEPFWNWFVHPISGSQLYLYYRANGYDRIQSLGLTVISSTLFEFTVEVYTEPASVQDLYQTPILGSLLGVGLENLSLYLLNSGNVVGKTLGHVINPASLFGFFEGKVRIIPRTNFKDNGGLYIQAQF